MRIVIVIATYNERENIGQLLNDVLALRIPELSVIVVDDNSPDGTEAIVEKYINVQPVSLIVRKNQRGYGSAHLVGFQESLRRGSDIIISMDADFSHQPKVIPAMIAELQAGFDVVIGSRRVAGGKIIGWKATRILASRTAMIITRVLLGIKTKDVTTGFRGYTSAALQKLQLETITSNGYSFLEELIYRCEHAGLKIKEIPIVFNDRRYGHSKFSIKEIMLFFSTIIRIRFKL